MKLRELIEGPQIHEGSVNVHREATTLGYKGVIVTGDFNCAETAITSLEGSPIEVGGEFDCSYTAISSLEGAPAKIGDDFYCFGVPIKSFHNIHKIIRHIGGRIMIPNSLKSNLLGLVKINGLRKIVLVQMTPAVERRFVELRSAAYLINKYLPLGNIHRCQEELIEAGLKEYARL